MRRVRLGRTEVEVSAVSVGTWPYSGPNVADGRSVGWSGHEPEQAKAALRTAFELGIDHWDTADVYGDGRSEQLLGEMLGELPRDKLFLASKTGWDPGAYGHFYHPDGIRERLERSLQYLGTDHLDLYYLHHCDFGRER